MKKFPTTRWPALLAAALLLGSHILSAQEKTVTYVADPNATPPELTVTLNHVSAKLSFRPAENRIIGEAELGFTPIRYRTDSIQLQAPGFIISAVTLDKKPCRYVQDGAKLTLYPQAGLVRGVPSTLSVKYESVVTSGPIYFIGWRPEEEGKRKQIWAHRPNGWLPYTEGRVTMDFEITFDKNFTVFTNGERISVKDNPDGTRTWHYRMAKDHPYFSTCLAIGDYDYKASKTDRGIPLELLYYRGMENRVRPTYQYTEAMFSFFEKETGVPYPYPVYRELPVEDYMYGGMETTTATVFGDYMLIDPRAYWQRNYINVNAHELAHQWYGDCIAHLAHKDVWLTESFGTYFAKIFEKSVFGQDYYENEMNNEWLQTMAAAKQNNFPVGGSQGGVARIYQKGSLVLGMLRYVMGDRPFRDAINLYTERSLFRYAETNDFIRAAYDATGIPWNWFFDEWVLRGGEPEYQVTSGPEEDSAGNALTVFNVAQVHPTNDLVGLFRMPVVFEVHYADGSRDSIRSWISDREQTVKIPNPGRKQVAFTLFDPGRNILKKVTFNKPFSELSAQALGADHMIDRYDALLALRPVPADTKRALLVECYGKETFQLTKSEIIGQMAGDNTPESVALLLDAVRDPDANVRKAALQKADPIPPILREAFEDCLSDSSYLNVELALDVLCTDFPEETLRYLELTKDELGWRGLNIRMKWLEIAIRTGHREYMPELIAYAGPKYEFETRINALNVLRRLNYLDPAVVGFLVSASLHWNGKLSAAGREVLASFNQEDAFRDVIRTQVSLLELPDKDLSVIEKILKRTN